MPGSPLRRKESRSGLQGSYGKEERRSAGEGKKRGIAEREVGAELRDSEEQDPMDGTQIVPGLEEPMEMHSDSEFSNVLSI